MRRFSSFRTALGITALLTTLTVGSTIPATAHAAPLQDITAMSSNASSNSLATAQQAYASLPKHLRDNPVVKEAARSLNLEKKLPHKSKALKRQADVVKRAPAAAPKPVPRPSKPTKPRVSPGCTNCVAITYDDGPNTKTTNWLLDVLKRKDAEATFFVTGVNAASHPNTLRRIKAHGHTIGNHSYTHPELDKITYNEISSQLASTSDAVANATGQRPMWLRPPYGATNGAVAKAAANQGMAQALWNVDTLDWKHKSAKKTCRAAVRKAQAGSIVLMHDIHDPTVAAAECIIDGLRKKGLEPVSLDRMMGKPQPGRIYYNR